MQLKEVLTSAGSWRSSSSWAAAGTERSVSSWSRWCRTALGSQRAKRKVQHCGHTREATSSTANAASYSIFKQRGRDRRQTHAPDASHGQVRWQSRQSHWSNLAANTNNQHHHSQQAWRYLGCQLCGNHPSCGKSNMGRNWDLHSASHVRICVQWAPWQCQTAAADARGSPDHADRAAMDKTSTQMK